MADRPYEAWTTKALIDYEQRLFDDETHGEDTWFARDQVLQELNYRDFGVRAERARLKRR